MCTNEAPNENETIIYLYRGNVLFIEINWNTSTDSSSNGCVYDLIVMCIPLLSGIYIC